MPADPQALGGRGQHSTSDTGTAEVNAIAETLSSLARELDDQASPDATLAAIVAAAVATVPGAEAGSISLVHGRRRIRSVVPTTDLPRRVDAIQEQTQQGPCLDAIYNQQTVRVPDMRSEQRWPAFAARAFQEGAGSMLSLQLYVEGNSVGALNLVSTQPDAFTDESEQLGILVATTAAIAYAASTKDAHLHQALTSRDRIGQAKGMLMERYDISDERAFLVLTRLSQNTNRKLNDIVDELLSTRTVSGPQGLSSSTAKTLSSPSTA